MVLPLVPVIKIVFTFLNLFISDYSINKIKIKLFPTIEEGLPLPSEKIKEMLDDFNDKMNY